MLAEGVRVDIVFLDYQKAFDTVPHLRLKIKLQCYCIGGKVLRWISEFLSHQIQRVSVNSSLSKWTKVIVVPLKDQCWGKFFSHYM